MMQFNNFTGGLCFGCKEIDEAFKNSYFKKEHVLLLTPLASVSIKQPAEGNAAADTKCRSVFVSGHLSLLLELDSFPCSVFPKTDGRINHSVINQGFYE